LVLLAAIMRGRPVSSVPKQQENTVWRKRTTSQELVPMVKGLTGRKRASGGSRGTPHGPAAGSVGPQFPSLESLEPRLLLTVLVEYDFNGQPGNEASVPVAYADPHIATNGLVVDESVTTLNHAPTDIALSNSSVAEEQPAGTIVGTLSTTDPDAGDTFTYALVAGPDNTPFAIDGDKLKTTFVFDYEAMTGDSYIVVISTTDQGGKWYEKQFTIAVTNVNETPHWQEVADLTPYGAAGIDAGDKVGRGVGLSGDLVILGAPGDDDKGTDAGAAYILRRTPAGWVREAKLLASDGAAGDQFGWSASISGNTAIVGSYMDDDRGVDAGSAYVFRNTGSGWVQIAKLMPTDLAAGDNFGWAVAIDDGTALVGANLDDDLGVDSGSAYAFQDDGSGWAQVGKLHSPDGQKGDQFGFSVSVDGDTALVGSWLDDGLGVESGAAYVFVNDGLSWAETAKLQATNGKTCDLFGYSVAISGGQVVAGAPGEDEKGNSAGAAYVFAGGGASWMQTAKLTATDGEAQDCFGSWVSISGRRIAAGAWAESDIAYASGAVYMFEQQEGTWQQAAKKKAANACNYAQMGFPVAIDGNRVVAGAWGNPWGLSYGTAYVFEDFGNHDLPPTADIQDVSPDPRTSAVSTISIVFSEPVFGFDLSDLVLTRDGVGNLLTSAQTLTSADGITWTLSNLAGLTGTGGFYVLMLTAPGSGITDSAGNLFGITAFDTWTVDLVPPTVSVDLLNTCDRTPPLTGHVDDTTATVVVTVNSIQYPAVNHGDGTWGVADNVIGPLAIGLYDVHATATDAANNVGTDTTTNELRILMPQVVGRSIFYNNSYWDGLASGDDGAIATDKQALLPGQTATFANYTSYSKGINGIMIDVASLPGGDPTASDFEFRVGNTSTGPAPASWPLASAVPTVSVRRGAGAGGSDRITLIFADGAIQKQWLRVKALASGAVGLASDDVFYFGNAIGEVGNIVTPVQDAKVTTLDVSLTRSNLISFPAPAPTILNRYDFNRDHKVNTMDVSLVRSNLTTVMNALKLITVPAAGMLGELAVDGAGGTPGALGWAVPLAADPGSAKPEAAATMDALASAIAPFSTPRLGAGLIDALLANRWTPAALGTALLAR
jgi:hypothetical protein